MPVSGVLLTPGSGGSADHPTLVQLERELPVPVVRYDFAYRRAGKRSPGRADRLVGELDEAAHTAAHELGIGVDELVVGGRSMGGRVASMAVAEGLPAAGLVLLSYPLHPPGRPDRLRVEHWPRIEVPVLFVSGPNDPFGSPDELGEHLGGLGGEVTTCWLDGGGHDPKNAAQRAAIVSAVAAWVAAR